MNTSADMVLNIIRQVVAENPELALPNQIDLVVARTGIEKSTAELGIASAKSDLFTEVSLGALISGGNVPELFTLYKQKFPEYSDSTLLHMADSITTSYRKTRSALTLPQKVSIIIGILLGLGALANFSSGEVGAGIFGAVIAVFLTRHYWVRFTGQGANS